MKSSRGSETPGTLVWFLLWRQGSRLLKWLGGLNLEVRLSTAQDRDYGGLSVILIPTHTYARKHYNRSRREKASAREADTVLFVETEAETQD